MIHQTRANARRLHIQIETSIKCKTIKCNKSSNPVVNKLAKFGANKFWCNHCTGFVYTMYTISKLAKETKIYFKLLTAIPHGHTHTHTQISTKIDFEMCNNFSQIFKSNRLYYRANSSIALNSFFRIHTNNCPSICPHMHTRTVHT